MSTNSTLIVLTPNARRVTIKVTPNTSILQVLEDACRKHGLDPVDYDLKHHNRIIDLTNSVRFAGLPNNATLEMVLTSRPREETSILLGLQLESGKRLMHPFSPQSTLWDVIKHWENAGEQILPPNLPTTGNFQPVCVYMRQEIVGEDQLQRKTLRSLGLTRGNACIRLLHRNVSQAGYQANISAPLASRHPSSSSWEDQQSSNPNYQGNSHDQVRVDQVDPHVPLQDGRQPNEPIPSDPPLSVGRKRALSMSPVPMETEAGTAKPVVVEVEPLDLSNAIVPPPVSNFPPKPRLSVEGALHILGEHQALVYHADDVRQPSSVSLPDSFFDVTKSDLEIYWRDLKQKINELENAPLYTSSLRNLQKDETTLRNLQLHPITVVRIRFQNRYVLQGVFRGVDTVRAVMHMVATHMANPDAPFYLFTSPPKTILDPELRLVEVGLVGTAVVYFGSDVMTENHLKEEVLQQLSCPDAIDRFLLSLDHKDKPPIDPVSMEEEQHTNGPPIINTQQPSQQPGPSVPHSSRITRPSRPNSAAVPAWFKPFPHK